MAITVQCDIVSAEEELFSGLVEMVIAHGHMGDLGILPGHTPLISRIRPGTMKIELTDGTEEHIFVAGGVLEVQPGKVTVLSDTAIRAADLDEQKALEARKRAEDALRNTKDKADIAVVEASVVVAAVS